MKPKGRMNLNDLDKKFTSQPNLTFVIPQDPLILGIPIVEGKNTRVYEIHCETIQQAKSWSECICRHVQLNDDNDD